MTDEIILGPTEASKLRSAEIVDLQAHKPHLSGPAKCMGCGHEWVAVSPIGVTSFECPSCELNKGAFANYTVREEPVFVCNCGNDLFFIHPEYAACAHCGTKAEGI